MMLCKNKIKSIISFSSVGNRRAFGVKTLLRTVPILIRPQFRQALKSSTSLRYKCAVAVEPVAQYDDDEVFAAKSKGHAAAAAARIKSDRPLDETWRINLGRGNVNQWLSGPRSEDWFTGMHPSCCPGEFC